MKKVIYSALFAGSMLLTGVGAPDANASWLDDGNPPCDVFDDTGPCGTPPTAAEELAWIMDGSDQVIVNGVSISNVHVNVWSIANLGGGGNDENVALVVEESNCDDPTSTDALLITSLVLDPRTGFQPTRININWQEIQDNSGAVATVGGMIALSPAVFPLDAPAAVPVGSAIAFAGGAGILIGFAGERIDRLVCVPTQKYLDLKAELITYSEVY